MPSEELDLSLSAVRPRYGIVKALGICNVVFSVFSGFVLIYSMLWIAIATFRPETVPPPDHPAAQAAAGNRGTPFVFNPLFGMDDSGFVRFVVVDTITGMIFTAIMFVTGLGLINLAGWGARGWKRLAWAKIARIWLFWGYFIVAIAPSLSQEMGRSAMAMLNPSGLPGRTRSLGELTRIYSIFNLVLGIGMIVCGTIYPALSLWLLSRPGLRAALRKDAPSPEPELR